MLGQLEKALWKTTVGFVARRFLDAETIATTGAATTAVSTAGNAIVGLSGLTMLGFVALYTGFTGFRRDQTPRLTEYQIQQQQYIQTVQSDVQK